MIVPRDGTKPNVLEGFEVQLFAPRLEDGSLYIVGDTGGWRKS